MNTPREAESVTGLPCGDEEGLWYRVGASYNRLSGHAYVPAGTVTKITVTCDLPGLHADMERVRVFDGDTMIFEAPLHSLEGVTYAAPAKKEDAA